MHGLLRQKFVHRLGGTLLDGRWTVRLAGDGQSERRTDLDEYRNEADHQKKEALALRESGELLTEIARSYNMGHSTISRLTA